MLLDPILKAIKDFKQAFDARTNEIIANQEKIIALQEQNLAIDKKILAVLVPGPAVKVFFVITDPDTGEILFEGESPLQAIMNRHTRRHVKPTFKDEDGNVTTLDQQDTPTSVVSANAAVTIENFDASTGEFDLVTAGLAGIGPVSLNGDADLTAGSTLPITGTIDITVPPGNAVTVDFELGAEQPNQ